MFNKIIYIYILVPQVSEIHETTAFFSICTKFREDVQNSVKIRPALQEEFENVQVLQKTQNGRNILKTENNLVSSPVNVRITAQHCSFKCTHACISHTDLSHTHSHISSVCSPSVCLPLSPPAQIDSERICLD